MAEMKNALLEESEDFDVQTVIDQVKSKYGSSIMIQFGNEQEQKSGTTKIKQKLFEGTYGEGHDTTENALCFLENMEKTRSHYAAVGTSKPSKSNKFYDDENAEKNTASRSGTSTSGDASLGGGYKSDSDFDDDEDEDVILDISPAKFEKPKDQLFTDFFGMYLRNIVDEKK